MSAVPSIAIAESARMGSAAKPEHEAQLPPSFGFSPVVTLPLCGVSEVPEVSLPVSLGLEIAVYLTVIVLVVSNFPLTSAKFGVKPSIPGETIRNSSP